jgi:uncharacterized protein YceK
MSCIFCCPGSSLLRCPRRSTQQPAGPTYQLTLRKPLGLVLAERKTAEGPEVFVEEVVAGGNAAKDGRVQAGDVLTGCSAVLLKAGKEGENEREGYGQRPYDNWEQVQSGWVVQVVVPSRADQLPHLWLLTSVLQLLNSWPCIDGRPCIHLHCCPSQNAELQSANRQKWNDMRTGWALGRTHTGRGHSAEGG